MIINVDRTGSAENLRDILYRTADSEGVQGLMVLACDANGFSPENVDVVLKGIELPVFGGIFPEIVHGMEKLSKGTIVAGMSKKPEVRVIPNLSNISVDYEHELDKRIPDMSNVKTIFVFVDGFAKRINAFVESLFNMFGLDVNYIGGGAGSMSMIQQPCLITNEGILADAGLLAFADMESGIGVSHGWEKVSGPFRVTSSDRNTINTLDWRPAFEVYRQVVEKHSGMAFTGDNFFEIAKMYPFGISRLETEYIVRDPFRLGDRGELVCVGEVPKDSFVTILNGDKTSLVAAARSAAALSKKSFTKNQAHGTTLFIDCISRVLFLEEEFQEELEAVVEDNIPLIGALTIGEIANSGRDFLEFYNKTAVVGITED